MKNFAHVNARSIEEAVATLRRYGKRAAVITGGTDLLGKNLKVEEAMLGFLEDHVKALKGPVYEWRDRQSRLTE